MLGCATSSAGLLAPARVHPQAAGRAGAWRPATRGSSTAGRPAARRLPRLASLTPQAELLEQEPSASANGRHPDAASLSPVGGSPEAAAFTGAANGSSRAAGQDRLSSASSPPPAQFVDSGLIVTTFRWPAALGGHQVAVCGSFSGWEPLQLHQSSPGSDFVRSIALPPGSAYFKYLVDGEWICSPCEQVVANGKGFNNHRLIQPTVTFTWRSSELGGQDVLITGSFNGWTELLPLAHNPAAGVHLLRCCLPQGRYQFQYFVDGMWLLCPTQPTSLTEQGRLVNSVDVPAPAAFHIHYATGWKGALLHYRHAAAPGEPEQPWQAVPMHSTNSRAKPLGGSWLTAAVPAEPLPRPLPRVAPPAANGSNGASGASGNGNGSYSNGSYANGSLNGVAASLNGSAGPHQASAGEVAGLLMWEGAGGGAPQAYRGLEFFISSSDGGKEDRPGGGYGGGTYKCPHPGGYKLLRGQLRPFPMAMQPPMMLVSDLDGTMVGEGEEADACTRDFAAYWEDNAALAGGVLVYNTGRSLGQFQGLLEWKAGALPVPDVLITAVGTKIWRLDTQGGTRGTASGLSWQEDHQWARTLDEGWHLDTIRGCVGSVLDRYRDAATWLDNGSEHPHRVCISARADVTPAVTAALEERVAAAGLQAKVIVSGTGDWRYIDVTAARAGKLAALEYVRQLYGVHRNRCVAAGDSGNDTLMLGGQNLAIVVGNAQPELVQWVLEQPQEERLVVTDAPMARGILEGLARHGLY